MARFSIDLRGGLFRKVLGFTFSHWLRQPWRAGWIGFIVMVATVADLMAPVYSGRLVDAVANHLSGDATAFNQGLLALVILTVLGLVAVAGRQLAYMGIIVFTLRMMHDVVEESFHRVQRFSTDWHANSFAGSTVRKITRGMWALDSLNDTILVLLFPSLVMLVGSTLLLGYFWWQIGLVVGLASLVFVVLTVVMSLSYVAPAATLANTWDTRLGGTLADAVSCNAVVKAFGAEDREEALLDRVVRKWTQRTGRMWRRGTLNGTVQGVTLVVMRTAILGVALYLWQQGLASAGDIAFVLTAFFVLQGYLREVGQYIRNLQKSVNDMEELVDFTTQPLGIADRPNAPALAVTGGKIAFENVTFHYGKHLTPLYRDFSVTIAPGERVGLVGRSGSGKTTFVKLLQRLYDVNQGQITIDGQDVRAVRQASLRANIAIVQQEPILFHRSLADNIAYGRPGATRRQIEEAARQASAHEFIMALPLGYETLVGERGVKLSGGERQRVAIARAFLADAPILVFDEATSSLDSESELLIQQAMERLMVGRTTLVIAHRLSTVKALDRLLVFDKGRIVEEGTHHSLVLREGGIYRRLFERQALELTKGLENVGA